MSSSHQAVQQHSLPLKGLRVIEFCHVVMGPSCGMILAELGAEVIKIEPAPGGDRTRQLKGHVAGSFVYFNRSKQSIGLNLKSAEGRAIAHDLVRGADAMTENFAPGTAERLGIGYEAISAINPQIVYCSLKGYLPGPRGNQTALDEIVQFNTGLAYMTGPEGRPLRAGASVSDIMGGSFGAIAILSALYQRAQTGRGQKVQSGLYESCAFLIGQHMAAQAQTGKPAIPLAVRPRSWGIYDTFTTGDKRTIFVGITSDKQWIAFCERFERTDLLTDPNYATNELRREHHDELYRRLSEMFAQHEADPLIDVLNALSVPAAPMRTPAELFDDPQLNAVGMSETLFANGTVAKLPRLPVKFEAAGELKANGQAPTFGQHSDSILASLGLSESRIAELRESGAVA